MKKVILAVLVLVIAAFFIYKSYFKEESAQHQKETPMAVSPNLSLTDNMGSALQAYYNLKDAFVKSDTALVSSTAMEFSEKIKLVEMEGINADTAILELARQLQQTITSETGNLAAAKGIETKRKYLQPVSDGLFDLLRTIQYSGSKVYQQYCPMAFNNTGASWLSNSSKISNPYFGARMPTCGDLRDSISIAKQ